MLEEARMLGEIVILAMFEHKDAARPQHRPTQHTLRQFCKLGQGIRGVGEDEIELLLAFCHKTQRISTQRDGGCVLQAVDAVTLRHSRYVPWI